MSKAHTSVSIGRLTTADVPLSDPAASRIHATIKRESGGYWIYDENSRNGTFLGSPPNAVFHSELKHGDTLRVGESEIRIDIGTGTATPVVTPDKTMLFGSVGEKPSRCR